MELSLLLMKFDYKHYLRIFVRLFCFVLFYFVFIVDEFLHEQYHHEVERCFISIVI